MAQIIPYPRKIHVLIAEDDWVIREVLKEHFRNLDGCRLSVINDLGQALYFLRLDCQAQLILSNMNLSGTGGVGLSALHLSHNESEVVLTKGYRTEAERSQAFDAGRAFYRVQPLRCDTLCRMVRIGEQISSYPR